MNSTDTAPTNEQLTRYYFESQARATLARRSYAEDVTEEMVACLADALQEQAAQR